MTQKVANPNNHTSAIINNKLEKANFLNCIARAFASPPFSNLLISLLGVVPKKAEWEFWLIHHLSYHKENSVNNRTPREFSSVTFANISQAITLVKSLGTGCFPGKSDIRWFFLYFSSQARGIPPLLNSGIKGQWMFYHIMCFPMACCSSCHISEEFSSALH